MTNDHMTLRHTLGKLRKGNVRFIDGARNHQGTKKGIRKYQSKIQWHISLGQDATAFQAEVAALLNYSLM